jgi:hypothetical protein
LVRSVGLLWSSVRPSCVASSRERKRQRFRRSNKNESRADTESATQRSIKKRTDPSNRTHHVRCLWSTILPKLKHIPYRSLARAWPASYRILPNSSHRIYRKRGKAETTPAGRGNDDGWFPPAVPLTAAVRLRRCVSARCRPKEPPPR